MIATEPVETIHLYVVRDEGKRPYTALPLFGAFLCLTWIAAITLYSGQHPYYEHEKLTAPAVFLPIKVFTTEIPIIPTGVKTYPATYAHGSLTFSNGSVIGQSVPAGYMIDGAVTDTAVYVPPAIANGFGMSTVTAHLLASGINVSALSINAVIGSSLFVRNLSPFTGGKPAYSITIQLPKDRQIAITLAQAILAEQEARIREFLAMPCDEMTSVLQTRVRLSWRCQFVRLKVPSYMRVSFARLSGKNFLVDVLFIPPLRLVSTR